MPGKNGKYYKKKNGSNIKNNPVKKLNKNQKKIKFGGYTKQENKAVDLNQEGRLKTVEKLLSKVKTLYNIRNPFYNNWIDTNSAELINTWTDMGSNQDMVNCFDAWDVTPELLIPTYNRNEVSGNPIVELTRAIPGVGSVEYLTAGNTVSNFSMNDNTCYLTKFKSVFNYRQYVFDLIDTSGDFPEFVYEKEYLKNSGIFKIRLYLISQPVYSGDTDDKVTSIARALPGPFSTKKGSELRVQRAYGSLAVGESNKTDKLKYTIHYDEIITPKFQLHYQINREVPAVGDNVDITPYNRVWMMSILRSPDILLNKTLNFSTTYNELNFRPNNLTMHWIMKFADVEQSKFIADQITGSENSQQVQYKNHFNIYVEN